MGGSVSLLTSCAKKPKVIGSSQQFFRFGDSIKSLMKAKAGHKTANTAIRISYFHHIHEINESAKGIARLSQMATSSTYQYQNYDVDIQLESMLARVSSLRLEIIILLEKSVYRVDDFVEQRKESAQIIYLMLDELEIEIKKSMEWMFHLNEIFPIVEKIVIATENLTNFK